jgi:hypothetical protein
LLSCLAWSFAQRSAQPSHYLRPIFIALPSVLWDGRRAFEQENIAITGSGTLDDGCERFDSFQERKDRAGK